MREINVEMRGDQMPESIDFGDPLNSRRLLRPEDVGENSSSKAFFCISGNCMEAAGIEEEGYAQDRTAGRGQRDEHEEPLRGDGYQERTVVKRGD